MLNDDDPVKVTMTVAQLLEVVIALVNASTLAARANDELLISEIAAAMQIISPSVREPNTRPCEMSWILEQSGTPPLWRIREVDVQGVT